MRIKGWESNWGNSWRNLSQREAISIDKVYFGRASSRRFDNYGIFITKRFQGKKPLFSKNNPLIGSDKTLEGARKKAIRYMRSHPNG